ncbi:DUF6168 family protein [Muriicola soli]|uniref:Uncharacterized protein n=1 Tax=Muriicola soli TaxID=2507538 RepID=A0A411ECR9_9FLAO|nr:DUF6168 family protein [Muriicola soli]QBA65428.1 hypothetical protein EQY75_13335 [Muriicola soli]
MKSQKLLISFLLVLTSTLALALWLHLQFQQYFSIEKWSDMLLLSYLLNLILAAVIFLILFSLRKKFKNQIGFLYMGGSLLKFLVFFVVFYPEYRSDDLLTKSEFAAFFIPYLLCLILETVYTAKILQKET